MLLILVTNVSKNIPEKYVLKQLIIMMCIEGGWVG